MKAGILGIVFLAILGCKEDEPALAVQPLEQAETTPETHGDAEPDLAAPLPPRAVAEAGSITKVLCKVGQTKDGPQSGEGVINVDVPAVASVSVRYKLDSEEKHWTSMAIECISPGKANIRFEEDQIELTVASSLSEEAARSFEDLVKRFDDCKSDEKMPDWANQLSVQVLVLNDGAVGEVLTQGSAKERVVQCVVSKIREWKAPASNDELRLVELDWRDRREVTKSPTPVGNKPVRDERIEEGQSAFLRGDWKGVLAACDGIKHPKCSRLRGTAYMKLGKKKLACEEFASGGVNHPECK